MVKKKNHLARKKLVVNISLFIAIICAAVFSILAYNSLKTLNEANLNRYESFRLREELRLSSDQLTLMARAYVVTGNPKFHDFFQEILDIRNGLIPRPEHYERIYWDYRMPKDGVAPQSMGAPVAFYDLLLEAKISEPELQELRLAQEESDKLVALERRAFALTAQALEQGKFRYSPLREQALDLVYGEDYLESKVVIMSHINNFIELQENRTTSQVSRAGQALKYLAVSTVFSYILLLSLLFASNRIQRKIDSGLILVLEKEVASRIQTESQISHSLEEKDVLLRELYHRTKNTLQQVHALILLQSMSCPDNDEVQELVRDSGARIQSIAAVHQLLYQSQDLSHISIKDYIAKLCSMLKASFDVTNAKVRFDLDIVDKNYLFDEAIPIGLILNELITNTFKHAFPNGRSGTISISLRCDEDGVTILDYSDDGVGVPESFDFEREGSLGVRLIHSIARDQLLGSIEMKSENGVRCRIQFSENYYKARV